jgi:Family of unknown function (DUF695)
VTSADSQEDLWATATGEEAGSVVIYRYRQNRPVGANCLAYPNALRVIWPYDASVRNGMPPTDDNELQVGFEDAIEHLGEAPHGYLMLVFTGNGRKEWLFYVGNIEGWMLSLNESLAEHYPYPLEIENWSDAAWETWRNFADNVTVGN